MADKDKGESVCRLVHGFGLRAGVQDNVLCVDETTAIFPVGRALAKLNIETQVMSFVSEGERAADLVLALALAPSQRCVHAFLLTRGKPRATAGLCHRRPILEPHAGTWQFASALSTHRFQSTMSSRSGGTRPSLAPTCSRESL